MEFIGLAGAILAAIFASLAGERARLRTLRSGIPIRVCVTGTRGKSTVTRLVASILRESGLRVVAKTTGSKPVLILPDGTERDVPRLGTPSVLEQKKVLAAAVRSGADAVVAEMMSIRPEFLAVEAGRIFRPCLLLITNVREDHQDEMGAAKAAIAASLAAAIPPRCTVLVPEEEMYPVFRETAAKRGADIKSVPPLAKNFGVREGPHFPENERLALAAADALGVDRATAERGLRGARPDFGEMAVYRAAAPRPGSTWYLVNAFAANEPESSARALALLEARRPGLPARRVALLALRADRGARTRQWLEAARGGFFSRFDRLIFIGDHARPLGRSRRPSLSAIATAFIDGRRPEDIMRRLGVLEPADAQIVGLGNIVGVGAALVAFWAGIGERVQ